MRKTIFLFILIAVASCKQEKPTSPKYADVDTSSNEVVHLTDMDDNYYSLEQLLDQYPGQLKYVHFWSRLSGDKVDRIEAMQKLEERYKGDLIAIHICLDRNNSYWKNLSQNVPFKNNFLARNYPQASFYEENNFYDPPRMMLYGRDNQIIDDNAMLPSNPDLTNVLDQLTQ
jgi:hypothetical protein